MSYDVVVIGAGVAGLAAARSLAAGGRRVVVLEARERIGGRVWTDHAFGPVPVERGAEFIHGARAATWAWVRRAGLTAVPFPNWSGRRTVLGEQHVAGPWLLWLRPDLRRVRQLDKQLAAYQGPDCSLAHWLTVQHYSPLAAHIANVRLAHANCATPETISVAELAHDLRLDGGGGDFHILQGYDGVVTALAAGLEIRCGTPVTAVRWSDKGVELATAAGELRAAAAVVTLPLALLKAGAVSFDPPLPARKQRAIAALVMRPAAKLLLRFAEPFWPADMTFLVGHDPVPVWWTNRPGVPLLTGFVTGPYAERLVAHGEEGAIARGLAALTRWFGPAPGRLFRAGQLVDWASDPWTGGGYSSVPPGAHGQRAALAEPCHPLYFAGEATVFDNNPATVHGAISSGVRAAAELA